MPRTATTPRSAFVHTTRRAALVAAVAGMLAGTQGCSSPFAVQSERDLRRSVIDSVRREIAQSQQVPAIRATEREGGVEILNLKPELIPQLEQMAGPASYDKNVFPMDKDLLGQPQVTVPVTLERAIRTAAINNLQVQFARLAPALAEAQVVQAQAAFDTTLFSTSEWNDTDQERAQFRQGFSTSGLPFDKRIVATNSTGLRRPLISGGQLTFQQDLTYTDVSTPGGNNIPDPTNELAWALRLEQPLLRGFGSDVTLAQVRLNRNAERDQICQLKQNLIRTATDTERTYWQLVQAHRNLLIVQRLYERGLRVRRQVEAREILDATPAQIAEAKATVFSRYTQVTRAQNAFRAASDTLKVLMNDPDNPIGAEALLVPVDDALDAPISFSLLDVLLASVRNRPEAQQAIISIDNTSIRMQVADNARLPRLDLRLQTRMSALGDDFRDNYDEAIDGHFIDYLIGIQFEQPIGNRAAEAQYRQRRLERMQATDAYRNTIQQVLLEAKRALRAVVTGYRLIEQTRVARYAQSENLRSLEAELQVIRGPDVQTLDLQFRRQEALSQAEQDEIQALIDYNTALAQLYSAMGTALERNKIDFKVPDADADLARGGLDNPPDGKVVPKDTNGVAPIGPKTPLLFGGERERKR
jgi:outer membrane protein